MQVLPSQRQGQKTTMYKVWVCLNKQHGWVLTCNCTCMAGLGSACSHAAALLFKLEAAVHFQLNEKMASTSQLCSWKASKKHVTAAPVSAIDFSRLKQRSLPKQQKRVVLNKHFSSQDPTNSKEGAISRKKLAELHEIYPQAAIFTSLPSYEFNTCVKETHLCLKIHDTSTSDTDTDIESDPGIIPEPLTSLFDPTAINLSDDALQTYAAKQYNLYCDRNFQRSYDNLSQITEEQSSNAAWMVHRAGRITASNCYYNVSRMKESKSLISTVMQYKGSFTSLYTEYGKEMEPVARDMFFKTEGKMHDSFEVKESGLVIDADIPCLGATPDGIVLCNCHGKGVLEIKCPYKYKEGFEGWQNDRGFPVGENFWMKRDHKYYYQIQLQMELCKADFGYFYIYAGHKKESMLSMVGKNDEFISGLKVTLLDKFFTFFLPEVVSRKLELDQSNKRIVHCVCKRPEFGNMIFCENSTCKIGWYHYPCINMRKAPRGKWFCKNCS